MITGRRCGLFPAERKYGCGLHRLLVVGPEICLLCIYLGFLTRPIDSVWGGGNQYMGRQADDRARGISIPLTDAI